jgi:Transcription factor WhiB
MKWWELAACKEMGHDLFYPGPTETQKARDAIEICKQCHVRQACLDDAIDDFHFGRFGIRGGLSEGGRRRIIRLGRLRSKVAV